MTSIPPNVVLNAKYSIAEAADLLGVHRNTIRNLTNAKKLKCGTRRYTGRKFYLGSEIIRFWNAEA